MDQGELYDIRGQLFNLRVVENMPNEIEKELQDILEKEKRQREAQNAGTSVRS